MNIVIPMAGKGSRFQAKGFTEPKPLIDVLGKPMIERVVDNLYMSGVLFFIVNPQHLREYPKLERYLKSLGKYVEVIEDQYLFQGQASSCLSAQEFICNNEPLLIANSDQLMSWDPEHFVSFTHRSGLDGTILTFKSDSTNNSYARLGNGGLVIETAEKKVISQHACCGVFHWARGKDFVNAAHLMMEKGVKTNGEYYVAPAYNECIAAGLRIGTYPIEKHYPIGTPEDLNTWISTVSKTL